jgi:hypothetical protein
MPKVVNNGVAMSELREIAAIFGERLAFLPPLGQNRPSISRVKRSFLTHFFGTEQAELKASFLDRPGVVFTLVSRRFR